jgi:hypothetical protein
MQVATGHSNQSFDLGTRTTDFSKVVVWAMRVAAAFFLIAFVVAISVSRGWPLVHDGPLLHYVVFLMEHGKAPYRDIVEMNMPGTYILDWLVIHLLGGGATGLWLWDTASGVLIVLAGAWIAGAGKRSAGIAGGSLAYLFHLSTGAWDLGQRDWVMAVIFMLAVGCLFAEVRGASPRVMTCFGALAVTAGLIKPPVVVFGLVFLGAVVWLVRHQRRPVAPMLLWAGLGAAIPTAIVAAFLAAWGVTRDFVATLQGLLPWYASLQRFSMPVLLSRLLPDEFIPVVVGAVLLFLVGRSWRRWETMMLLLGALCGAALFLTQGKGWSYHLGLETCCLGLWAMLELERGLRGRRWEKYIAFTTLVVVTALLPRELATERSVHYPMTAINDLQRDLKRLGGSSLSGNVQCLDMTLGSCINALYRLQLVQSTGFIYDYYLFPQHPNAVTDSLQRRFLDEVAAHPPKVIVLSSHIWPEDRYGYDELANWPEFDRWFEARYRLGKEEIQTSRAAGYRIYLFKGSATE